MKLLIFFSLFLTSQFSFSQKPKIDSISKNVSELLIQRGKIEDSKYAIKIKNLFPDEDFSKFEDSPAELLLNMLHGSELELPITWNKLMSHANNFGIENDSKYYDTYFHKTGVDNYIVTCVIKSKSSYYIFSFNLLEWKKDVYISRFYNELRKFENIKDIEFNPFVIVQEEMEKEIKKMEEEMESENVIIAPQKN